MPNIKVLIQTEIIDKAKEIEESRPKKTSGRKRKKKRYFTTETELAIVLFNNLDNPIEKNIVYKQFIHYPFTKIVENIYNRFKFSYFDSTSEDVQSEVVSNLLLNIHKYNPDKGKAFSYFSVVAKNYLIIKNNGNYNRYKATPLLSTVQGAHHIEDSFRDKQSHIDLKEFKTLMVEFWERYASIEFSNEKEIQVAHAILELFRRIEYIEQFNKKALYIYIREMCDVNTQTITRVINKMKEMYFKLLEEYHTIGNIERYMNEYEYMW